MKQTKRRYIYTETFNQIMKWARRMIQSGMIDRPPNYRENFPFYLEQYINHLKFQKESDIDFARTDQTVP